MGYDDLGSGYYFINDRSLSNIIYTGGEKYSGTGLEVIPPQVTHKASDENYIVAISYNSTTQLKNYWIIEKSKAPSIQDCNEAPDFQKALKSNVVGPLDSLEFRKNLEAFKADLDLNE
jgi:acyl-CoA synthetase (AMP-forming)/AMP-acid ligase II